MRQIHTAEQYFALIAVIYNNLAVLRVDVRPVGAGVGDFNKSAHIVEADSKLDSNALRVNRYLV